MTKLHEIEVLTTHANSPYREAVPGGWNYIYYNLDRDDRLCIAAVVYVPDRFAPHVIQADPPEEIEQAEQEKP